MASINLFPTFEYSQPNEYHFSHDSVFLARRIFDFLQQTRWQPKFALDLCAGCGVIGLDLLFHLRTSGQMPIQKFDFLDIQESYKNHFDENVKRLSVPNVVCHFIKGNYADKTNKDLHDKYDLIVCNPPYFLKHQGKLPVADLKLRSRFFVDSDFANLIGFIFEKLSSTGQAFVLIRNRLEHKQNQMDSLQELCRGKLAISVLNDIRGTHLVKLELK